MELLSFFDGNGDGEIGPNDIIPAFRMIDGDGGMIDGDGDKLVSREEFEGKGGVVFERLCGKMWEVDRFVWEERTKETKTTQQGIFAMIDANKDGKLTASEYKKLYVSLDKDKDKKVSTGEVRQWMNDNLHSIC